MRACQVPRAIVGFFSLVFVVLVTAACSQTSTPTPTSPVASPVPTASPAKPVVWRIGLTQDITTTNVWSVLGPNATPWNFYVLLNRYPSLYRLSDVRLDWVPLAAQGFPSAFAQEGDLWTATVTLKPGIAWSDGKPVTAEDVAFTVNTVLEFDLPGNWARFVDRSLLDRAEALDERTVKFYFTDEPGLARWQFGTATAPFVAEHYWRPLIEEARQAGSLEERQQALFGIVPENEPTAGEMLLARWEKGAFVEMKANDDYFFGDSTVTQFANGAYLEGKPGAYRELAYGEASGDISLEFTRGPYATSVIFSIYPSQDAAVLALQKGEIDYFLSPTGLQRGFQRQLAASQDVRVLQNESNNVNYLGFNMRRPPMDSAAFRQAVSVLIDKEFVAGTVLQGAVDPAYSLVPPGNRFWHNADVSKRGVGLSRKERIAEAVRLLTDAGFTYETAPVWDDDKGAVTPGSGLRMPSGEMVQELEILSPNAGFDPFLATFAIWTERWLREAGIPVRTEFTAFNSVIPRFFQQDLDMWVLGWGLTTFPDYLRGFFHSSLSGMGGFNAGGYANPEFDDLADRLVKETDLTKAREIAFQLQDILAEDAPYVFLFTAQILEPVRANVQFPYTRALSGLQNYFQSMNGPLSYTRFQ